MARFSIATQLVELNSYYCFGVDLHKVIDWRARERQLPRDILKGGNKIDKMKYVVKFNCEKTRNFYFFSPQS
jgi:hypothetical protein